MGNVAIPASTPEAGASGAAVAPSPRLVNAAHEFEAQMMKELLKPLNQPDALSGSEDSSGGDDDQGSAGALGEFASEALGRAISNGGGFGIARSILHEMTLPGNRAPIPPVIKNTHGNTVIKSIQ